MKKFYIVILLSAVSYNLYSMEAPVHEEVDLSGRNHEGVEQHEKEATEGQKAEAGVSAIRSSGVARDGYESGQESSKDHVVDGQKDQPSRSGGLSFSGLREQREGQADTTKSAVAIHQAQAFLESWYGQLSFEVGEHDRRVENYGKNKESVAQMEQEKVPLQKSYDRLTHSIDRETSKIARLFEIDPATEEEVNAKIENLKFELSEFNRHVKELGKEGAQYVYSRRGWEGGRRTDVREPDFGTPEVRTMLTALGIKDPADMTPEKAEEAFDNLEKKLSNWESLKSELADVDAKIDSLDYDIGMLKNDNANVDHRGHIFEKYKPLVEKMKEVYSDLQTLAESGSADARNLKEQEIVRLLNEVERISKGILKEYQGVAQLGSYHAPEVGELSKSKLQKLLDWIADVKHHLFGGVHADVAQASSSAVTSASFEN